MTIQKWLTFLEPCTIVTAATLEVFHHFAAVERRNFTMLADYCVCACGSCAEQSKNTLSAILPLKFFSDFISEF